MKLNIFAIGIGLAALLTVPHGYAQSERAQALARGSILVDTHIDVPWRLSSRWSDVTQATADGDYDYPRARSGGLDVLFMSIYTQAELNPVLGGHWQVANQLIDSVEALAWRAPDKYQIVTNPEQVRAAVKAGKIGFALGMENGSPIGDDLANVKFFHDRGVRYITLAHSKANLLSDSSYDVNRPNEGLSDFGRQVVAEMNRLGMMVDVSHLSDQAVRDVLDVSRAPVIASHSSVRHYTPDWERNISDELIKAVAEKGGVIGINFGSSFLTKAANEWNARRSALRLQAGMKYPGDEDKIRAELEKFRQEHPYPFAQISDVLDHIDHVVKLVGVAHVGIGSDYDGVGDSLPVGLKSVADYPNLVDGLLQRDYSEAQIKLILGENFLRAWQQVEDHARR